MRHSKKFDTVKGWHELGKPNSWIRNAVVKGWITEEEYYEITGEEYE